MIPKVIHYCWFGGAPLPESVEKCIQSWKTYCPDYEIRRWDENSLDVRANRYAREALEAKKWAFVSDWARLYIVYHHGGIYFDTDVELLKPLDNLVEQYDGFFGFENEREVATGLGFGACAHNRVVKAILDDYEDISFLDENGKPDLTPCPQRNTLALVRLGVDIAAADTVFENVRFLPPEYLCPYNFETGKVTVTQNTLSFHHYDSSWCSKGTRFLHGLRLVLGEKAYRFVFNYFLYRFSKYGWW